MTKYLQDRSNGDEGIDDKEENKEEIQESKKVTRESRDSEQDPLQLILKKFSNLESVNFILPLKLIFKKIESVNQNQINTSKNMNRLSEKITKLEKKAETKKG